MEIDLELLAKERKATQAYLEWANDVARVHHLAANVLKLYAEVGMSAPPSLESFLGRNGVPAGEKSSIPTLFDTPPDEPSRPSEAEPNWVWVPFRDSLLTSATLARLRGQNTNPIQPPELFKLVKEILPDANEGSMANIGLRLDGKVIDRTPDGWVMRDKTQAPIAHTGFLWGPPDVFQPQEIAAHRRLLILHLLKTSGRRGLRSVNVLQQLRSAPYCHVPVAKDLVKDDLAALERGGLVRRAGLAWVYVSGLQPAPAGKPNR